MSARMLTYRQAFNKGLRLEMRNDQRVVVMGEDVCRGATVSHLEAEAKDVWADSSLYSGLAGEFGRKRLWDTAISESAFMRAAAGAAMRGLRPIADLLFVDFFGVCFDQIYNQAAKLRFLTGGSLHVPMVVHAMIGAGWRLSAQHSHCHYSVFTHMPGLKTVVPATPL